MQPEQEAQEEGRELTQAETAEQALSASGYSPAAESHENPVEVAPNLSSELKAD